MSDFVIRKLNKREASLLKEFTYLAIYVPQGAKMPPQNIVELPELRVYYQDFGMKKGDICLVAEAENKIVGAVWTRIVNDFAHIDDDTPSLAIAVAIESRGKGIGTRLLNKMLAVLKDEGFLSVSLSVQKENFAVKMYKRAGFEVVKDNGEELIMLKTYNAILTADIEDAEHICSLVQSTIKKVYPRYYAKEAVDFFCKLHSVEAIIKDIEQGSVKILLKGDKIVATGSRTGNHITRVFVVPEEQGRGFGTLIMNKLESEIAEEGFQIAHLETSLPAKDFYERAGYIVVQREEIELDGKNNVLKYEVMEKTL